MEPLTTAGMTLIIGSIALGAYRLAKRKKTKAMNFSELDYVFSKSDRSPKAGINKVIRDTQNTLDVAMFLFTEKDIARQICNAAKRGVSVRVISDRNQSARISGQSENMGRFTQAGIPVKVNAFDGNMHLKIMISDHALITTGSYNFTYPAESKNDEVLVMIKDKTLAENWTKQFNKMWNDSNNYLPYQPATKKKAA